MQREHKACLHVLLKHRQLIIALFNHIKTVSQIPPDVSDDLRAIGLDQNTFLQSNQPLGISSQAPIQSPGYLQESEQPQLFPNFVQQLPNGGSQPHNGFAQPLNNMTQPHNPIPRHVAAQSGQQVPVEFADAIHHVQPAQQTPSNMMQTNDGYTHPQLQNGQPERLRNNLLPTMRGSHGAEPLEEEDEPWTEEDDRVVDLLLPWGRF
jgi:hypothetical protein